MTLSAPKPATPQRSAYDNRMAARAVININHLISQTQRVAQAVGEVYPKIPDQHRRVVRLYAEVTGEGMRPTIQYVVFQRDEPSYRHDRVTLWSESYGMSCGPDTIAVLGISDLVSEIAQARAEIELWDRRAQDAGK